MQGFAPESRWGDLQKHTERGGHLLDVDGDRFVDSRIESAEEVNGTKLDDLLEYEGLANAHAKLTCRMRGASRRKYDSWMRTIVPVSSRLLVSCSMDRGTRSRRLGAPFMDWIEPALRRALCHNMNAPPSR